MKIKPQKNLTNDKKKLTKKKRRVCAMGIRDERIFSTMNLILSPIMLMVLLWVVHSFSPWLCSLFTVGLLCIYLLLL